MNYTITTIESLLKYPFKLSSKDSIILDEPLTTNLSLQQFQIWCYAFLGQNPYENSAKITSLLLPLSNLIISSSKTTNNLALVYQFFELKLHQYLAGLVYTEIEEHPQLKLHSKPETESDNFFLLQIEVLKFFSIILEGLKNDEILGYLYSNKFLSNLTTYPEFIDTLVNSNNSSSEEAIAYWITLLKNSSLKLKQNNGLVELFINQGSDNPLEKLPIYFYPIKYFNNSELMIRISVKVLCLNLFSINNQSLIDLITCSEGEFDFFKNWTNYNKSNIEKYLISISEGNTNESESIWTDLVDNLEFLNDILLTPNEKIFKKIFKLTFFGLLPIINNNWKLENKTEIRLNEVEYFRIINLILKTLKSKDLLNSVVFSIFYNELSGANIKSFITDSELINEFEGGLMEGERLCPVYTNNPNFISYLTSINPSEEGNKELIILLINFLKLIITDYSKELNQNILLNIGLLPSKLVKDYFNKHKLNNLEDLNEYSANGKPWLKGLIESNSTGVSNAHAGNLNWSNLVYYNPNLFQTLLNWLTCNSLLNYPKLTKSIKALIIDLIYFPGTKYCLNEPDGVNLLNLFNSNKLKLSKLIPNLILKPMIWLNYFNYFKELEENNSSVLNTTSFGFVSYSGTYSKLKAEHLELFKGINLHYQLYHLLNWILRLSIQKLGKLSLKPPSFNKKGDINDKLIHLKKSSDKISVGLRIPSNYPTIENLIIIPNQLSQNLKFYKLQKTRFLKVQSLKLEYSFDLLELEFLPYLPENSGDRTLFVKNIKDGQSFNLVFLNFGDCENCRTLMFQSQLQLIEKVEKKLISSMKLDQLTNLEDNEINGNNNDEVDDGFNSESNGDN